jgi:hypothetical protein
MLSPKTLFNRISKSKYTKFKLFNIEFYKFFLIVRSFSLNSNGVSLNKLGDNLNQYSMASNGVLTHISVLRLECLLAKL